MNQDEQLLRTKLGQELRRARQARKLTQNTLAELVQTDPETISRFERGATLPSLVRLLELADALDVSLSSLLVPASPRAIDEVETLRHAVVALSNSDRKLAMAIIQTIVKNRQDPA